MNRHGQQAISFVEMLVALGVMQLLIVMTYATVHASLRLHQRTLRGADRCALAEQLTADFRHYQQLAVTAPGQFTLTRRDGRLAQYLVASNAVERVGASRRKFRVAGVEVAFRGDPAEAMRVEFTDSELIIRRQP